MPAVCSRGCQPHAPVGPVREPRHRGRAACSGAPAAGGGQDASLILSPCWLGPSPSTPRLTPASSSRPFRGLSKPHLCCLCKGRRVPSWPGLVGLGEKCVQRGRQAAAPSLPCSGGQELARCPCLPPARLTGGRGQDAGRRPACLGLEGSRWPAGSGDQASTATWPGATCSPVSSHQPEPGAQ